MKLWKSRLKIWEMLRDTSPEETTQSLFKKPTETKGSLSGKRNAGEYSDKRFCIGDSNWCYQCPVEYENLLDSRIDGLIGSALFPADY